jgi:glycerol-3-phosphate cytidylyltransferase
LIVLGVGWYISNAEPRGQGCGASTPRRSPLVFPGTLRPADSEQNPYTPMKTVITYGTFDLFHRGHLRLLERLKHLGDRLIVGVSTDEFNALKGKRSFISYEDRAAIVGAVRHVDLVIPERSWDQKRDDIKAHGVDVFAIGDDWAGKFDSLKDCCEVVYLSRTEGVSSTALRRLAGAFDNEMLARLDEAHSIIVEIMKGFQGR